MQGGELKKAREAAGNLHEMGLDTEKIAQAVGYAVESVKMSCQALSFCTFICYSIFHM